MRQDGPRVLTVTEQRLVATWAWGMTVQPPGRPRPQVGDPMNGFGFGVAYAIGPLAFWLYG